MTPTSNGHRLVLFDIDGTLLSAGRAARESVLAAIGAIWAWKESPGLRYDFSGKTDPQILRELVERTVPDDRLSRELPRALDLYLEELERRLDPAAVAVKPGIPQLVDRLSADPRVTLGLLTGNLERGARLKLEPPGLNRYFPFGAFGSDSEDRYRLPALAIARAHEATGRVFSGKSVVIVGDSVHDVACGRSLGVRAVAVATGPTPRERLLAEEPDACFDDFSDVDRAFEAILS